MAGYAPTIYLRNTFRMKWDKDNAYLRTFLEGKQKFIQSPKTRDWKLVAAFAEWPLLKEQHVAQPDFDIIQIWRLADWPVLYRTMVDLSETSWYRRLGATLTSENQELLINAGVREPHTEIHWSQDDHPGYTYVYEVSRPKEGRNQAYLREVNWLSARMSARYRWELVWWASQITAQPAQLSILWRVLDPDGSNIVQQLVDIAQTERYNERTLAYVQTLERRIYHPIYTERLAQLAAG